MPMCVDVYKDPHLVHQLIKRSIDAHALLGAAFHKQAAICLGELFALFSGYGPRVFLAKVLGNSGLDLPYIPCQSCSPQLS